MKKLIACLVAVMAVGALHAASINWTITGSTTTVANDYLGNAYTSKAYLVLASNLSSITSDTQTKAQFESALAALCVSDATSSDGKKPAVSGVTVTDDKLASGVATTFGLVIVSEDEDGNGFYKVITATGTPYVTGATADAQTKVSTAWNFGTKSWVQGYATPQPVPEPATGALALAGVALLFRRRRA